MSVSVSSEPRTVIVSASDVGYSNYISPQSFLSRSSQSSNQQKREEIKQNYLLGKRKRPLMKHCAVAPALEEPVSDPNAPTCRVCHVSLRVLADTFKGMRHTGSALKKRKSNPPKKRRSIDSYRDLSAQNAWLLANVYNANGNYIFCQECVVHYLGVGKQRLSRLRKVKIAVNTLPTVHMMKEEVCAKKLESRVKIPANVLLPFSKWWSSVDSSTLVQVHNPAGCHGLCGKRSNNSKEEVMNDFLKFVDLYSQPNGRQAGSYGPHFYFDSRFTRFDKPKKSCKNFSEMCQHSVVATFNDVQLQLGRGTCSSAAASMWLKENRPKHAVSPQKLDGYPLD